jgi:hypothetical protein
MVTDVDRQSEMTTTLSEVAMSLMVGPERSLFSLPHAEETRVDININAKIRTKDFIFLSFSSIAYASAVF